MILKSIRTAIASIVLTAACGTASAIPTLQLGILDGTWDSATETVVASNSAFTLYAFLTPGNGANVNIAALLADTYYISAALMPKTSIAVNYGSFNFGGTNVNVTGDMTYGNPPLESVLTLQGADPGDLASHGIYGTFFKQFSFQFNAANEAGALDVGSAGAASLAGLNFAGTGMYYATTAVDVSALTFGGIHFDLYSSAIVACKNNPNCVAGDVDISAFAPFSHDAQSRVPEPGSSGTLALLGLALMAGSLALRRKARN